jgi:3',5'-cyclic AMP phosphodiesterase CpdA
MMARACTVAFAVALAIGALAADASAQSTGFIRFIVISDVHYGIKRASFRGDTAVDAQRVNAAMVAAINALPSVLLPEDAGVASGRAIGAIDFIALTGDIANRAESGVQTAKASWAQFSHDYLDGVTLTNARGQRTPLWAVPGNHDASNAVGFPKPLSPPTDPTSMVELYNRMVKPAVPRTAATYRYATDKVLFSRDLGGIHFAFLNVWPDSMERAWLDRDLRSAPAGAPVILFAHDPPAGDPKHFTNPNGAHDVNPTDNFENLLSEQLKDGPAATSATVEAQGLADFVKSHDQIAAYFHGHSNYNEFYQWRGPDSTIALRTFRVDSPMKGRFSATDESKLSFQVVVLDTRAGAMTVREYLWNAAGGGQWGATATVPIK